MKTLMMIPMIMMVLAKSPMIYLISIIMVACLGAGITFMWTLSYWMNMLLLLMFVSGMMVLFMYLASLSISSKTFSEKSTLMLVYLLIMSMMLNSTFLPNNSYMLISLNVKYMNTMMMPLLMMIIILILIILPPKLIFNQMKGLKTSK